MVDLEKEKDLVEEVFQAIDEGANTLIQVEKDREWRGNINRQLTLQTRLLKSINEQLLAMAEAVCRQHHLDNSLPSSLPDVFGCQIVQTFMVAPFIVVGHELSDLSFKIPR